MKRARAVRVAIAVVLGAAACGTAEPGGMSGPTINNRLSPQEAQSRVISADILAREPVANRTMVKHILIGWRDKANAYGGSIDPRAANRTKQQAEAQVEAILEKLRAGGDFDALMTEYSEDKGSAASGRPFEVSPDAHLVIEFRQLGLRLQVGEVGVTESDFGFHVIKRLE